MDTNYFRPFDQLRLNELSVTRSGFFRPRFEVTDGQFVYARLSHQGWAGGKGLLETANATWTITRKSLFSRVFYINTNGEKIGEITPDLWTRRVAISLTNGINAIFTTKKVFTRTFTIMNDQYGDIVSIEQKLWKFGTPFIIRFDQNVVKDIREMPLFILSGIYLALLRQRQAAAAH